MIIYDFHKKIIFLKTNLIGKVKQAINSRTWDKDDSDPPSTIAKHAPDTIDGGDGGVYFIAEAD